MNAQMKQHLAAVIDTLVESDTNGATAAFHEYVRLKSKAILMGESAEEEDKDDSDEENKEDKDDKKKSDNKEDKDDKKKSDATCED